MSHDGSDCNDEWGGTGCHNYGDYGADYYLSGRGDAAYQ